MQALAIQRVNALPPENLRRQNTLYLIADDAVEIQFVYNGKSAVLTPEAYQTFHDQIADLYAKFAELPIQHVVEVEDIDDPNNNDPKTLYVQPE